MEGNINSIPRFDTEDQEAEYWDTHSPLDIITELELQEVRVRGAKNRPITIRLDTHTRQKLNKLAAEQGLGPSTFARSILVSTLERRDSPPQSLDPQNLREMMEQVIPPTLLGKLERLMEAATIGDPEKPSLFILDTAQTDELEKIALQAAAVILSHCGAELVVTKDHPNYERVREFVQASK